MKKILFLLCTWSLVFHVSAKVKLEGKIMDGNTSQTLEYVNLRLLNADSVFIRGTASGSNGEFIFENLEKGDYLINASYIGYEELYISISNLDENLDVGEITMHNSAILLNDITVTANPVIQKPDRQIIFPTKMQLSASTNGITLLRNLHLARVVVNPVDNTIKLPGGENVQLRINGVEVTQAEIIALKPTDVIKINYHDNPGLRYGNAGAVIDYIIKRKEFGGSVSANLSNGISNIGYGENNFSAKYNYLKSEFSTTVYWGRRDLKWTRENFEQFNFIDKTLNRSEIGNPTKVKYDDLNFSINYNLQNSDNHLFNIRFRNNHNNTPNSFSDRISTIYQNDNTLSVLDKTSSEVNIPSIDVYYQAKLKKDQQIIFNIVGTYLNTKNERTYQEKIQDELTMDIYSNINGKKHSLISEGIYEKNFSKGKLSTGIKHTQSHLENKYTGNAQENISMNTSDTYIYAEYSSSIKKLDYTLGLGGMRRYNSQNERKNEEYTFRPNLKISYNLKENLFLRYNGYISAYTPSLSELNNISQAIDSFQIRRGHPNLKTVRYFSNDLSISWYKEKIAIDFFARYSYDHKPVMENVYLENEKFIRTTENHKSFHRINLQTSIQILPYKEYIAIKLTPFMNRYISNGNDYNHTHTNFGLRGSLMGMYKNWTLVADMNTSYHTLWGETVTKEEKFHSINIGYNKEKWSLTAGMLNPFTKRYELEIENKSTLAPYLQKAYSTKLSPLFIMNFTLNLDFGRSYNSKGKRINNEDSESGILSGKK